MRRSRLESRGGPLSPRRMLATALGVAGVLLCLLVLLFVAGQSPWDVGTRRVRYAKYRATPVVKVIADLERAGTIPRGTAWTDPSVQQRRVTVTWFAVSGREALEDLERLADLDITYVHGHHGEMLGPVTVAAKPVG
jgi:hypothetical protein